MGVDPAFHTFQFYRRGEGFIEGGIALGVDKLVGEFMENQPRQFRLRIVDECGEHRIIEIAQRGVGRYAAHIDVIAHGPQFAGVALRVVTGEISAVADASDDEKTPLFWLYGELVRGEHIPRHEGPLEIGIFGVAAVVGQSQFSAGELTDVAHLEQLCPQRRGRVGPGEHIADRLRLPP